MGRATLPRLSPVLQISWFTTALTTLVFLRFFLADGRFCMQDRTSTPLNKARSVKIMNRILLRAHVEYFVFITLCVTKYTFPIEKSPSTDIPDFSMI